MRAPREGVEHWGVVAEIHTVVERWLADMRPQLEAIAGANGGEYDGWEAAAD
ncbi:MAG: hypothetical protein ICV64_09050 [Thermoleophilia bacterium]|nr:hypothetical protein [Thermoleophilia bacterium]